MFSTSHWYMMSNELRSNRWFIAKTKTDKATTACIYRKPLSNAFHWGGVYVSRDTTELSEPRKGAAEEWVLYYRKRKRKLYYLQVRFRCPRGVWLFVMEFENSWQIACNCESFIRSIPSRQRPVTFSSIEKYRFTPIHLFT